MKLRTVLMNVVHRELVLAYRHRSELINPLLFFVIVVTLFPLAISPDSALLHTIAPGLIWVSALLATLLSLNHLFRTDFEDGTLTLLILSPHPLSLLILAKTFAHWLTTGLPLILITPLLALLLHLSASETMSLLITLLLGTPVLTLIGAIGTALTVGLRNGGILLSLLVLPLYIPILIFGAGAVMNVSAGLAIKGQIALLGALLLLAITFAPLAAAAALKIGD